MAGGRVVEALHCLVTMGEVSGVVGGGAKWEWRKGELTFMFAKPKQHHRISG